MRGADCGKKGWGGGGDEGGKVTVGKGMWKGE